MFQKPGKRPKYVDRAYSVHYAMPRSDTRALPETTHRQSRHPNRPGDSPSASLARQPTRAGGQNEVPRSLTRGARQSTSPPASPGTFARDVRPSAKPDPYRATNGAAPQGIARSKTQGLQQAQHIARSPKSGTKNLNHVDYEDRRQGVATSNEDANGASAGSNNASDSGGGNQPEAAPDGWKQSTRYEEVSGRKRAGGVKGAKPAVGRDAQRHPPPQQQQQQQQLQQQQQQGGPAGGGGGGKDGGPGGGDRGPDSGSGEDLGDGYYPSSGSRAPPPLQEIPTSVPGQHLPRGPTALTREQGAGPVTVLIRKKKKKEKGGSKDRHRGTNAGAGGGGYGYSSSGQVGGPPPGYSDDSFGSYSSRMGDPGMYGYEYSPEGSYPGYEDGELYVDAQAFPDYQRHPGFDGGGYARSSSRVSRRLHGQSSTTGFGDYDDDLDPNGRAKSPSSVPYAVRQRSRGASSPRAGARSGRDVMRGQSHGYLTSQEAAAQRALAAEAAAMSALSRPPPGASSRSSSRRSKRPGGGASAGRSNSPSQRPRPGQGGGRGNPEKSDTAAWLAAYSALYDNDGQGYGTLLPEDVADLTGNYLKNDPRAWKEGYAGLHMPLSMRTPVEGTSTRRTPSRGGRRSKSPRAGSRDRGAEKEPGPSSDYRPLSHALGSTRYTSIDPRPGSPPYRSHANFDDAGTRTMRPVQSGSSDAFGMSGGRGGPRNGSDWNSTRYPQAAASSRLPTDSTPYRSRAPRDGSPSSRTEEADLLQLALLQGPSKKTKSSSRTRPGGIPTDRSGLVRELFDTLDLEGIGHLGANELRVFAALCGVGGDDDEWVEEYMSMCKRHHWDPLIGADGANFRSLLDEEDTPYWCSDERIQDIIMALCLPPSAPIDPGEGIRQQRMISMLPGQFGGSKAGYGQDGRPLEQPSKSPTHLGLAQKMSGKFSPLKRSVKKISDGKVFERLRKGYSKVQEKWDQRRAKFEAERPQPRKFETGNLDDVNDRFYYQARKDRELEDGKRQKDAEKHFQNSNPFTPRTNHQASAGTPDAKALAERQRLWLEEAETNDKERLKEIARLQLEKRMREEKELMDNSIHKDRRALPRKDLEAISNRLADEEVERRQRLRSEAAMEQRKRAEQDAWNRSIHTAKRPPEEKSLVDRLHYREVSKRDRRHGENEVERDKQAWDRERQPLQDPWCDEDGSFERLHRLYRSRVRGGGGQKRVLPGVVTRSHGATEPRTRSDLIREIFVHLTETGESRLGGPQLELFMVLCNFVDQDDPTWSQKYHNLCADRGWNPGLGISLTDFEALLSEDPRFECPDEALRALWNVLRQLESEASRAAHLQRQTGIVPSSKGLSGACEDAPRPRQETVREIFSILAEFGSGRLDRDQLLLFARLCGFFDGSEETWDSRFAELTTRNAWNPESGITLQDFEKLVAPPSDFALERPALEALLRGLRRLERRKALAAAARGEVGLDGEGDEDDDEEAEAEFLYQPRPVHYPPTAMAEGQRRRRQQLVGAVFRQLDTCGLEALGKQQLRLFGELLGKTWPDLVWEQVYEDLRNAGIVQNNVIGLVDFARLVSDPDAQFYCDDALLYGMVQSLRRLRADPCVVSTDTGGSSASDDANTNSPYRRPLSPRSLNESNNNNNNIIQQQQQPPPPPPPLLDRPFAETTARQTLGYATDPPPRRNIWRSNRAFEVRARARSPSPASDRERSGSPVPIDLRGPWKDPGPRMLTE